jgi:peptide/nickel transport system ATP-binding protein
MYAGQTMETGAAKDVFTQPLHPYTHGLLDCIPIPGKTRRGDFLGSIPGMVPTPVGTLVGCTFRNRCSWASEDCTREDSKMRMVSETHGYRCLLGPEKLTKRA